MSATTRPRIARTTTAMATRRAGTALGAGVVAAVALAGAVPAAGASPANAQPASAAAESTPPVATSTNADVDGDGRADFTELKKIGIRSTDYIYRLSTRTATKRRFSTDIRVPRERDDLRTSEVWVGAAGVDGLRGAEIIVDRSGGIGDFPYNFVYTVRQGKWQLLLAPGAKSYRTSWSVANHPAYVSGYEFTMNRGIRRVVATRLQGLGGSPEAPIYNGKRITYRWVSGEWRHSGTVTVKNVPDKQAQEWSGWNGLIWR